ncbi:MAG: hypothetical protein LBU04_06465 [Christensenellaceae bacterium]|jgi:vacuolar-type H+-ATPase subunit H|nr:hypothetical protein [Christensenellaceae bacterium]
MIEKVIESIKLAEQAASQIASDALSQARSMSMQADNTALEIVENAKKLIKEERQERIVAAELNAETICDSIYRDGNISSLAILNNTDISNVAEMIASRFVDKYVSR